MPELIDRAEFPQGIATMVWSAAQMAMLPASIASSFTGRQSRPFDREGLRFATLF
jgi:hypothetical protein